jgi:hypothetical protein
LNIPDHKETKQWIARLYAQGGADRQQAIDYLRFVGNQNYADKVYERRTLGNINPDNMSSDPGMSDWEYIEGLELPDRLIFPAKMLLAGYLQVDIVEVMGCSQQYVSQLVSELRDIMSGAIGEQVGAKCELGMSPISDTDIMAGEVTDRQTLNSPADSEGVGQGEIRGAG